MQVIFLLSPDTEFSSSGTGKKSNICYWNLFHLYKKVLVTKWATKCIATIVTSINYYIFKAAKASAFDSAEQDDHADAINRALAALDMDSDSESDAELNNPVEDPKAIHNIGQSLSALTEPDATTSTIDAGDSELQDSHVSDPDILGGENIQDVEGSISNSG